MMKEVYAAAFIAVFVVLVEVGGFRTKIPRGGLSPHG